MALVDTLSPISVAESEGICCAIEHNHVLLCGERQTVKDPCIGREPGDRIFNAFLDRKCGSPTRLPDLPCIQINERIVADPPSTAAGKF